MELKAVLGRRRTIRFYQPFRPVEREKIEKMLEAARHASCAGNVMNVRAIVIWRDEASDALIKAITPPIGYQQMQTAPCFLFWYNETAVYHGANWIESVINLAKHRRIGIDPETTTEEINTKLRPTFEQAGETMGMAPLAFLDVGQAIAQATLIAYEEGLGTCLMSGPRIEQVAKLLNLPKTAIPACIQSVGYPAESWEAGGQTPKPPFDTMFHEMVYGQEFTRCDGVQTELRQSGLIDEEAPLPWRAAELRYLARALELEDRIVNQPIDLRP